MQKTLIKLETSQQRKEYLQELCDSGEYEVSLAGLVKEDGMEYIPFGRNGFAFICGNRDIDDLQYKNGEVVVRCFSKGLDRDVEHYIRKKKEI